jgi:hypothetical protein
MLNKRTPAGARGAAAFTGRAEGKARPDGIPIRPALFELWRIPVRPMPGGSEPICDHL